MERKPWKLAACFLGAAAIFATAVQAQEVTSNVVGYVKVDLMAGSNALLSTPFDQVDGSANTVDNVLGDQVPDGSSVFTWNGSAYDGVSKLAGLGWTDPSFALPRGAGWWVSAASDASILILGEVPESDTTLDLVAGNNLVGNPVPVESTLSTSGLDAAPDGTSVFFWDGSAYSGVSKLAGLGWTSDEVLQVGEGFFVAAAGDFQWNEPAP